MFIAFLLWESLELTELPTLRNTTQLRIAGCESNATDIDIRAPSGSLAG
jgi:hypothetical protein